MLFPSEIFLFLFLPSVVILYYGIFRKHPTGKNICLFLASILFYAYGEPVYVFLMLAVILLHYCAGLLMDRFGNTLSLKKGILICTLAADLVIFLYFKYLDFLIDTVNQLFGSNLALVGVALPIGISFYMFQAISYVVDVYRGTIPVEKNPLHTGLYIALFPQLIAGPIVRYETISKEMHHRTETLADFSAGVNRFLLGLGKKVLLANKFAVVADAAFQGIGGSTNPSVLMLWLGAVSYTLQIYFDFSGYSDMAIGLGRMFGFTFCENFRYPYMADSISDFWRRWHISLQTWFRDYVYIPLGGSRVAGNGRLILNLFIVWALTGLWHGANLTFVVWGLLYFLLLVLERFCHIDEKTGRFRHLYTMFFVMMGWVLFRSDTLGFALLYIKGMFGIGCREGIGAEALQYLRQYLLFYIAGIVCCFPYLKNIDELLENTGFYKFLYTVFMMGIFLWSIFSIFNDAYSPFIYFHF